MSLVRYLNELDVEVRLSPIENITHRLIDFCEKLEYSQYIIRISGSQLLLNMEYFDKIINDITTQGQDYFYCKTNDGQVPEVVKSIILVQYKSIIGKCARYYQAFKKIPDLTALEFSYLPLPIKIHPLNKTTITLLERYFCDNGDISLLKEKLYEILYELSYGGSWLNFSGYIQTLIENIPMDSDGQPIPWYTYSMINLLKERLQKDMKVFEFGAGYSTLFYSNMVQKVVSVEHDLGWYNRVIAMVPSNVEMQYVELEYGGDYSKAAQKYSEEFDLVCVDGRDRCNCAINSISALKKDGIIIFDDTDRIRYAAAYQYLKDAGFKRLNLCGPAPAKIITGSTSVFYRANNCFGL